MDGRSTGGYESFQLKLWIERSPLPSLNRACHWLGSVTVFVSISDDFPLQLRLKDKAK
jgi:hypothetical protein